MRLWSKRWSTARGWHWVLERECSKENASAWLAVFQKDEPGVEFILASRRPK